MSENDTLSLAIDTRDASTRRSYLRRIFSRSGARLALGWIGALVIAAIFAPIVSPADPIAQDLTDALAMPSWGHLLGTDQLGRDILSRLIYGTRETLLGALLTVAVAVAVGLPLGTFAGYVGGWFKVLVGRFADLLLTLPAIIVLLAVLTVFGNSMYAAMASLGVLVSAGFMRLSSASASAIARELFVDAARVSGMHAMPILIRHVVPNVIGPIIVQTTIVASLGLLLQASLGFLGLGTRPPFPSWGQMVAEASQQIYSHPWLMIPAGVTLMLTVLSVNTIGDSARDSLFNGGIAGGIFRDPRPKRLRRAQRGNPSRAPVGEAIEARRPADTAGTTVEFTASTASQTSGSPLLAVDDLHVTYPVGHGAVEVVKGVSFAVERGRTLGLVGESGSGKSVSALAVLGLVPHPGYVSAGSIRFDGLELSGASERTFSRVRGRRIALISQEPMVALDPCYRVSTHLREMLQDRVGMSRKQADSRAIELLETVDMPDPRAVFNSYPHQLSGGMAQRVAIAWALAGEPELLIADEPTTALDVTVQAEVLELLRRLGSDLGMAVLLLTHDLGVVADLCDDVAVMKQGLIVENEPVERIFDEPQHEYTRGLLRDVRVLHGNTQVEEVAR
ncbi:MAG: dipeptide/oligopeptide/nickel ABC transporter permease/ATP-binding protein [Pseudoclavibacter sp.]